MKPTLCKKQTKSLERLRRKINFATERQLSTQSAFGETQITLQGKLFLRMNKKEPDNEN